MAAEVVVLTGPARSGKTHELVRRYRVTLEAAPQNGLDRAIWLAPNGRTAAAVRRQLVIAGLHACLRPGVLTFDVLTGQILAATNSLQTPLPRVAQRELLRRVVAQVLDSGKLTFFADAATRAGFIDLLAQHIAELRRRDIRPQAYANIVSRRTDAPQHRELALLYADYESQLANHRFVDHESALGTARDALAQNACPRFQNLELIVADGFTDFTCTEHAILRLLAQRAKQLLVSLPTDSHSVRPDLFAKTTATLSELRRNYPQLGVRQLEPRPIESPAIDYLTQHVFRHPKHIPEPSASVLDSLPQLEIVGACGAQDEIVQIARRIKALLTGEVRPGQILVVFRSLADIAPRVREVFSRFGIPYSLDARPPLASAAVVKTLVALLRLDQDDWPFRRVVAVLTNHTLSALDAAARRAADWLVRDLQIAAGRSPLLDRVQALAAEPSSPHDRSERLQRRVEAAAAAQPALVRLAQALDKLPQTATPTEWCEALSHLGAELALSPFVGETPTVQIDRFSDTLPCDELHALQLTDLAAWQSIAAHFAALERLDAWLGQPPRQLSRSELIAALLDVSTNESFPPTSDDAGRVCVVAAPSARNGSARHLFLAGMSEQAFPSPERAGSLATDAEYDHFARAAHQASISHEADTFPSATRAQAEMLLFYEVLSRAAESLTISYPALDDKAQTLPPSPYVVELERILGAEGFSRIRRTHPQLSPVPLPSTSAEPSHANQQTSPGARGIYCVRDWRIQAVARATETHGDRRLLAGIFSCQKTAPLAAAIDAGLRIVHDRASGDSFGAAEGLLSSPAVAERLAERFGPKHAWSASRWETYATCPFRFFMEAVLGLEPLGDLVLETDFARRGSRLHDVLAAFHRQWLSVRAELSIAPDDEPAEFLAHLQQVIEERTSHPARGGIDAALLELDRRQILKWAAGHFNNQQKYDNACMKLGAAMTPAYFEFRFGLARRGDSLNDPDSTTDALVLNLDGEPIHITGQIDRIDTGKLGGKQVFNVIDYKSGRRAALKTELLETGQQLQLPIYVEAAQALVFHDEATPLAAGYWSMGSGFDSKAAPGQDIQTLVHRLIRQFIDGIRRGDFPVASRDEKCTSTCTFNMVCRVAQVRSLGKSWQPELENKS